jgi:hypothetical protein
MKKTCALIALLFLAPVLIHAQAAPKADSEGEAAKAAEMVGTWRLSPHYEGHEEGAEAGPGAAIRLQISLDADKLTGTAIVPIPGGEKRWPIVDAAFDGKTFTFSVDNGEDLLSGKMERVDGKKFEGSWVTDNGEEGGRLSMTRAEQ